jgi:hypothetical protein
MKLSAMIAGTVTSVLLAGLAVAQNPSTPPAAPSPPTAEQSAPDTTMARHTMTGEATRVSPEKGRLFVKTPEGRMLLHFPSSALQNVKKDDNVTVELALKDNGPAPKTK